MNALIIYAHPNPSSFTNEMVKTLEMSLIENGHNVKIRDLYKINFNPILSLKDIEELGKGDTPQDIKVEQDYINFADTLFFVFPTWWESMPAIMRGYIDRVFSYGFAYGSDENGAIGMLKGKKGVIIQGAGASKEEFDRTDMKRAIEISHNTGIFEFCGIKPAGHFIFNSVNFVSDRERQEMLSQIGLFVKNSF